MYGQMNEPPGARARVALTGLTVAEYFRDQEGQDVLLFIDNIFRFTQAGSEVILADHFFLLCFVYFIQFYLYTLFIQIFISERVLKRICFEIFENTSHVAVCACRTTTGSKFDGRTVFYGFCFWQQQVLATAVRMVLMVILCCRCRPFWVVSPRLSVINQLWPLTWVLCRSELPQLRRDLSPLYRLVNLASFSWSLNWGF